MECKNQSTVLLIVVITRNCQESLMTSGCCMLKIAKTAISSSYQGMESSSAIGSQSMMGKCCWKLTRTWGILGLIVIVPAQKDLFVTRNFSECSVTHYLSQHPITPFVWEMVWHGQQNKTFSQTMLMFLQNAFCACFYWHASKNRHKVWNCATCYININIMLSLHIYLVALFLSNLRHFCYFSTNSVVCSAVRMYDRNLLFRGQQLRGIMTLDGDTTQVSFINH